MNIKNSVLSFCCGLILVACGTADTSTPNEFDWPKNANATVGIEEYLDRTHYRIITHSATYLLDSASGGLSSMIDVEGNDWIAFKPSPWGQYPASAASAYRGSPNLVFKGQFDGAGHPGHIGVVSEIVGANQVLCHTPDGPWAWTWTFEPNYAQLDVHDISDTSAYWFLYEGPVGGKYQPKQTYYATNDRNPSYSQYDHYSGRQEIAKRDWFYFGNNNVNRTLFMLQVSKDSLVDHYSLLGNDSTGINSPDGMVVAGFGRASGAVPLLRTPHRFFLGFNEGEGISAASYSKKLREIERLRN